ncbi:MAG: LamG domain-containing protein [Bacteroidales bacterium]|nr:LamG domain-containing protein [Bacteroidales bacterium]MBQ6305116.1 LamG domain-containing protein [Bacteroidales bacterium]
MQKEILTITRVTDSINGWGDLFKVDVYYEFFNPDPAKDLIVGFEATSADGNAYAINMGCETSTDTPTGEGYSMEFNGTSSSLSVPSILPTGNAEWAINVWIKTGSNNSCFISSENRYMGVKNSKILCGGDGAGGSTYTTTATISQYLDFQWHMVTLSYNKSKVYVYMDGMLVEIFGSSYCYWNKPTINIGAHYSQGIYYSGKMDNFRSYNRALTASEIQTLYNAKQ